MKPFFLWALGAFLMLAPTTMRAQSQAEMNAEAGAELEQADKTLNAVYARLMKENKDDAPFCSDLKEAQRAWLKYVEYHLKTAFPLREGENPREVYGSIYPLEYASLKTQLTNERIAQLQRLTDE